MRLDGKAALDALRAHALAKVKPATPMINVGTDTCGNGNGAEAILGQLRRLVKERGLDVKVSPVGCFGFCAQEPFVNVYLPGWPLVMLHQVTIEDVPEIVESVARGEVPRRKVLCKVESWDFLTGKVEYGQGLPELPAWDALDFFRGQKKTVLRDAGLINPEDVEEYVAVGGYQALCKALHAMSPESVLEEIKASRLRGRGGAGFPTWKKWESMQRAKADQKYVICNADEGDPGAYMNRNEIESDPHALIEGMIVGAYVMGASRGIVYVRAEYPLAVKRLEAAIRTARAVGLLGEGILGSRFSFDLDIVEGAGAFVCGEETALIASVEGKAGRPAPRPPYPAQKGLWGRPTNINNVETWCNVPVIVANGGEAFTRIGSPSSPGTKVFSLVGKIKNTGLVELPLGTPLRSIIYEMGGGTGTRKKIKAVQTGGPSGGCIPARHFDASVDYESLNALGAIMGSGGMVVMDQDNCMVDVARYFVEFTAQESCGKCTSCREGLAQALAVLDKITRGEAEAQDVGTLEALAPVVRDASLCGLGQTSVNPVLTTLRYFREDYRQHVQERRCAAGVCEPLFTALCENSCPLHMNIPGYLQLVAEDRLEEAFELTLRDNPLPGTLGRICHFHCQMQCRRETVDEPVAQGEMHRFLSDAMYRSGKAAAIYQRLAAEKLPPTGKKVAVVGAGPAGLTAAYYLVRLGHEVTVYDAQAQGGGICRYGIPAYRLPKSVLDQELSLFEVLGVNFRYQTRVGAPGSDVSFAELARNHDAVYLATGAHQDQALDIPGKELAGVYPGYAFLEDFAQARTMKVGRSVAVIGAGNVAIDAARSILRTGAEVTVVYRRDRDSMPANESELRDAEAEGVAFRFFAGPGRILDDGRGAAKGLEVAVMKRGDFDASGRRQPVATGKTEVIDCDTVILAIGERVDASYAQALGIPLNPDGTLQVQASTFRAAPGIYAGGDAVSGPATAAEAMGMAKRAAAAIDAELMGASRFDRLSRRFDYQDAVPSEPRGGGMNRSERLPVARRLGNFEEVLSGYSESQAKCEASRCLRCDVKGP
jgi:NADH-quinone oxidoreductase subunit F